jgi:hypothetical protein
MDDPRVCHKLINNFKRKKIFIFHEVLGKIRSRKTSFIGSTLSPISLRLTYILDNLIDGLLPHDRIG